MELAMAKSELSVSHNEKAVQKRRVDEAQRRVAHMENLNGQLWALLESGQTTAAASPALASAVRPNAATSASPQRAASSTAPMGLRDVVASLSDAGEGLLLLCWKDRDIRKG